MKFGCLVSQCKYKICFSGNCRIDVKITNQCWISRLHIYHVVKSAKGHSGAALYRENGCEEFGHSLAMISFQS